MNISPIINNFKLEQLEERFMPSIAPITALHYTPGANFNQGAYAASGDPGSLGFNLVAVYSPDQLNKVPQGDKALVWLGLTNGVDNNFINTVTPYLHDPRVYGFYVADEPNPAIVPASNLKAESDWIHNNDPGAKTFFVIANNYTGYTPQNTDMDLIGLDPYHILTWGDELWAIPYAVLSVEELGWSNSQIVPIYQAFGGAGIFANPSVFEEEVDLFIWKLCVPTPQFDYAYSWAEWGATSLMDRPDLQALFYEVMI